MLNKYGLLKAANSEKVSENCMLFSIQNILLSEMLKEEPMIKVEDFDNYVNLLRNEHGMFNNMMSADLDEDKYTSHDQLTSIACYSVKYEKNYHKEIWDKLKQNKFTYNNITGKFDKSRMLHPRDIIFYAYLAKSPLGYLLFPLFCLITIVSFLTKYKVRSGMKIIKTDGELLSFVKFYSIKPNILHKLTFKICTFILNKKLGGWASTFKIYFTPQHPNYILGDRL